MWLEIEGGVLLNLDLIDKIEPTHHKGIAAAWVGGVMQTESKILYQYFERHKQNKTAEIFTQIPAEPKPSQS